MSKIALTFCRWLYLPVCQNTARLSAPKAASVSFEPRKGSAEGTLLVQVLAETTTASQTTDGGVTVRQSLLWAVAVAGLLIMYIRTTWLPTEYYPKRG
ncbi:hypothetical protein CSKR_203583 [Clonorchis sinensis]|uniref:Uncharacterized protein n=1 Tax=Clonorchis sinensis TaxID=79923 RepID=A0A8T1MC51_CLOSI|nr:hypothetical protein CSKR_203583 [Clonorchis sinensis]